MGDDAALLGPLAAFNRSLAKFELVGIAPAPRGVPQIEVSFDIDANGIASVSARDKISGKEQAIKITPSTGLGKEEIDRMIHEAQEFAETDRKMREVTELRNRVKVQASYVSKSFSGYGWVLDRLEQDMVKEAIRRARNLSPTEDDFNVLKELQAQLEDVAAKLGDAMFSSAGNRPAGSAASQQQADQGEEIDRVLKSALADLNPRKP